MRRCSSRPAIRAALADRLERVLATWASASGSASVPGPWRRGYSWDETARRLHASCYAA